MRKCKWRIYFSRVKSNSQLIGLIPYEFKPKQTPKLTIINIINYRIHKLIHPQSKSMPNLNNIQYTKLEINSSYALIIQILRHCYNVNSLYNLNLNKVVNLGCVFLHGSKLRYSEGKNRVPPNSVLFPHEQWLHAYYEPDFGTPLILVPFIQNVIYLFN